MKLFSWLYRPKSEISVAREQARESRGKLATKVAELDEHRHLLDQLVRDSLNLLESKK